MNLYDHFNLKVDPSNRAHQNQLLEDLDLQALDSDSAHDSANDGPEDEESDLEGEYSEFTRLTPVHYSIWFLHPFTFIITPISSRNTCFKHPRPIIPHQRPTTRSPIS